MVRRRFTPLIALVVLGLLLLVARLAQVQVLEHDVWAGEAANLVRSGRVVPYRRGEIRDARGRSLAHDEEHYEIEFGYRDFRREHPLGQVAHALSALESRPVTLAEALDCFGPAARALVQLTHEELDRFASGGAIESGPWRVPACDDAERDDRRSRCNDVRFYVTQLLGLDRGSAIHALAIKKECPSFLESLRRERAKASGVAVSTQELLVELDGRVQQSVHDLEQLAALLPSEAVGLTPEDARAGRISDLVSTLERWRQDVEDDTASELFREASGFDASRVDPALLAECVDFHWLAVLLRWDEPRTRAWLERSREAWLDDLRGWRAVRVVDEARFESYSHPLGEALLAAWCRVYAQPTDDKDPSPWGPTRGASVLAELDSLFELSVPRAERAARLVALPFQDETLRALDEAPSLELLARAELWTPPEAAAAVDPTALDARASEWREHAEQRVDARFLEDSTRALLWRWESLLQSALAAQLHRLTALASEDEGAPSRLELADARLDRAEERARFVLKDRGSRPQSVAAQPSYALVHLLTRYPERYPGFFVREGHERVRFSGDDGRSPVASLVGRARGPDFGDARLQLEREAEFESLRRQGSRSAAELDELLWAARRLDLPDELRGSSGIEAYFDHELSGTNGYREEHGLQELIDRGAHTADLDEPPRDGEDVTLTIDLDLQRAALETLAQPELDPDRSARDEAWLARPTGAIVLVTPAGDVLAAASFPDQKRGDDDLRDAPLERTLTKWKFQPPGSVFKPFVAAWALDRLGLDPRHTVNCTLAPDGRGAGYKDLHCSNTEGHGPVDLHEALKRSCNSYFAWLGEQYQTGAEWTAMAREFGFGQPTGVRCYGKRAGLFEHDAHAILAQEFTQAALRKAANGLSVVEATPMQVARAFAGLATGVLPEMRLVASIGGVELARNSRPLQISQASLDIVRVAMRSVAGEQYGSAYNALNFGELGFEMAAKTGSADLAAAAGDPRVRKHTWLAGYFPADKPVAVLVVFLDDTRATSSHSAIWVARQFLRRPELRAWLDEARKLQ